MRPGQQNKRGRGRNSGNGRKSGNPLSRTYDSTGPDVKIRGTAQHVAEKYAALARDALGSGDTVMAENYLQHAEHYNRIIATAQAAMQERYQREERENREQPPAVDAEQAPAEEKEAAEFVVDGTGPQPVISGTPVEIAIEEEGTAQPQRRQSTRRRAPVRQRRPRNAPADQASADEAASQTSEEPAASGERRTAAVEAPDGVTEVAAAAPDA